jgi:hypothetical protein
MHRGLHRARSSESVWHQKRAATLSFIDAFDSDPFLRFLDAAPVDDEPVTAEEEASIAEVERDRAAGVPTIPFDEIKRAFSDS